MHCPRCQDPDTRVAETRLGADPFAIRRRRICSQCGFRFSTLEVPIKEELSVQKRDGRIEEFDREKIIASLQHALKKGHHRRQEIETIAEKIISQLVGEGKTRLLSKDVGQLVLQQLKTIDEFAYIRYLTLHQTFANLEELRNRISNLENRS